MNGRPSRCRRPWGVLLFPVFLAVGVMAAPDQAPDHAPDQALDEAVNFLPLVVRGAGWQWHPAATDTPAPPVDECANAPADWVFCDGFETGARWDGAVTTPFVRSDAGPFGSPGNHVAVLRVSPGAGGSGLWKKLPPSDRLYARWYVQWEPGHDISARHHGPGGLGADTAWFTGRSGIRPMGDEYFVSTLEASTGLPHVLYAYTYSRGMYMDCADPDGRCWGDLFPCYAGSRYCTRPQHLPKVEQAGVETGRWHCLEQMIDAGSPVADAASADGQLDFWVDGVEIGPWTDLWWRTVPTLKVNFLWLFLYHHDDAHTEEGLLADNVVVSTAPIGCPDSAAMGAGGHRTSVARSPDVNRTPAVRAPMGGVDHLPSSTPDPASRSDPCGPPCKPVYGVRKHHDIPR